MGTDRENGKGDTVVDGGFDYARLAEKLREQYNRPVSTMPMNEYVVATAMEAFANAVDAMVNSPEVL